MGMEAREWINQHLSELRKSYPNKTVIVCEGRVVKALDEPLDPVEINEIARKLCADKDWSYTYVLKQEEEYIL